MTKKEIMKAVLEAGPPSCQQRRSKHVYRPLLEAAEVLQMKGYNCNEMVDFFVKKGIWTDEKTNPLYQAICRHFAKEKQNQQFTG